MASMDHVLPMRPKNRSLRSQSVLFLSACVLLFSCALSSGQVNRGAAPLPDSPQPSSPETKSFLARWADFYRQDWFGPAASSPAPPRRGVPSPLDSPPFPNSDWSYGGSPVIGEPDTNSYPLMTAINGASSRTKLYGWLDPRSTSVLRRVAIRPRPTTTTRIVSN